MDPFVLLDDAAAGDTSLLSGLARVDLVTLSEVDAALRRGWSAGLHCFAWLPYDLGELEAGLRQGTPGALYWFTDHRRGVDLPAPSAPGWLAASAATLSPEAHAKGVAAVQDAIAAGTSYQVNYTFPVRSRLIGDPIGLYLQLRQRQPVAFGVCAHLPGPAAAWTLSLSPELFVEVADSMATTRPMKGTAMIDTDPHSLRDDQKNRAENLMIVDLLRNDLAKVAVPGTVAVPRLFQIERVGRLWQMTSTVTATLLPDCTPGDLLGAMFPCGSITGAPKLASMGLIRSLEPRPRGLYTGSLGTIEPDHGEFGWRLRLNVAIRTIEIDLDGNATLGIGSGIVADSDAGAEWNECQAKADFATKLPAPVRLLETIAVIDGVAPLLEGHVGRLATSAAALGFVAPCGVIEAAVAATAQGSWALRLCYSSDGEMTLTRDPLDATQEPVAVLLASQPWPQSPLSAHKTSDRKHLDEATALAVSQGAFDTIGYDWAGRVLEGGRCSVFAQVNGRWLTPRLGLGLLAGVQRAALLSDPGRLGATVIDEAELSVDQLRTATRIVVANALRGPLEARLED